MVPCLPVHQMVELHRLCRPLLRALRGAITVLLLQLLQRVLQVVLPNRMGLLVHPLLLVARQYVLQLQASLCLVSSRRRFLRTVRGMWFDLSAVMCDQSY